MRACARVLKSFQERATMHNQLRFAVFAPVPDSPEVCEIHEPKPEKTPQRHRGHPARERGRQRGHWPHRAGRALARPAPCKPSGALRRPAAPLPPPFNPRNGVQPAEHQSPFMHDRCYPLDAGAGPEPDRRGTCLSVVTAESGPRQPTVQPPKSTVHLPNSTVRWKNGAGGGI
jgi:hypothetical protein